MTRKFYVDWSDEFYPEIRDIKFAYYEEEPKTFLECKKEIYEKCDAEIRHWRERKKYFRSLRVKDLV